jgi:hypothetical protein
MFSTLKTPSSKGWLPINLQRGAVFGMLIVAALMAFEMFNYSTTEYSLTDLLGQLEFLGIRWSTILAIAFCTIDFAGLARLFTPEQGADEPVEVWYLFGAWMLAAIMNAMLTWWGVSVAIVSHTPSSNILISADKVLSVVPIFVALMVFLIRVLIIGTFTVAGERLFSQASNGGKRYGVSRTVKNNSSSRLLDAPQPIKPLSTQSTFRAAPKPMTAGHSANARPEPSYHPLSFSGSGDQNSNRYLD